MPHVDVEGRLFHYRERGTGPVALFVHGFPLDATLWLDQLAGLAERRRCVAVDLRGSGLSAPVAGEPLTMERHAADLAGLLDRLEAAQADLIGLSMGGYIALAFAERFGHRLRSLALADTRSGADSDEGKAGRDAAIERVLAGGRAAFAETMLGALLGPHPTPEARARLRTMAETTPYETIIGALAGMRDRPDRTAVLATVPVPAAVIVGADDTVTPPAVAEEMAAALPDATLHVIAGSGHLTPIEQPDAVNEALGALFDRAGA